MDDTDAMDDRTQDRYSGWKRIGRGGTADVYKCRDTWLDEDVAIKLLHANIANQPALRRTLHNEVLSSRDLRVHPNIAVVHDFYAGERGFGIVMEFVKGCELRDWMDKYPSAEEIAQTAEERLQVLLVVFEALAFAHRKMVHRDLKPQNIMLENSEIAHPRLMDFGFSLRQNVEDEFEGAATPKYMSPEQYLTPANIDHRSDLFTMGIIAYELFTGLIPPTSLRRVASMGLPPRVAPKDIKPPSLFCKRVPPSLDRLIIQMMSYEPMDRPPSAAAILEELKVVELRDAEAGRTRTRVTVPGGMLMLGSGPENTNEHEKPRRRVVVNEFVIDRDPVTNSDYREFMRATGAMAPPFMDDAAFGRPDHPVVGVTWVDARAFAQWIGGALPSEAQWEIAAKGPFVPPEPNTPRVLMQYPWGDEGVTPAHANIDGVHGVTSSVGSFPKGASPCGAQDMCGNVWEWCEDVWDPDAYRTIKNGDTDPRFESDGAEKTLRGGAYDSFATQGRCAFRFHALPDTRRSAIGFRVAYTLQDAVNDGHKPQR
jgi:formylglycine-generating enzyme required for sulfatase activity/tRNA A-37 threonylcarbamoyl transferase component Bud32